MRCFMTQIYRPQLKNVLFVTVLFVLSVFTVAKLLLGVYQPAGEAKECRF